jgi:hypothetical protein
MVGAVIVDEIRRIGRKQDRPLTVHHPDHVRGLCRIAAQQAVFAEQPEITRAGDGIYRRFGNDVLAGEAIALVERRQQPVQVLALETGQPQIETGGVQRMQLGGKQFVVPAGKLGQPIVGDPIGAHLLRRQV